jgi:hypothetical protein
MYLAIYGMPFLLGKLNLRHQVPLAISESMCQAGAKGFKDVVPTTWDVH